MSEPVITYILARETSSTPEQWQVPLQQQQSLPSSTLILSILHRILRTYDRLSQHPAHEANLRLNNRHKPHNNAAPTSATPTERRQRWVATNPRRRIVRPEERWSSARSSRVRPSAGRGFVSFAGYSPASWSATGDIITALFEHGLDLACRTDSTRSA